MKDINKLNIWKDKQSMEEKVGNKRRVRVRKSKQISKSVCYGRIYVSITNNVVNFKIRLPWEYCKAIGISDKTRKVCCSVERDKLIIELQKEQLFKDLSPEEKILQINKYRSLYRNRYERELDFMNALEKHFKCSYRTAYRYIKYQVPDSELKNVKLLKEQQINVRNRNISLREGVSTSVATLTIPSALAIQFLKGKTCEELGIKNIIELYNENDVVPVYITLEDDKIYIEEKYYTEEIND